MGSIVRIFLGTVDYLPAGEIRFKPWTGEGLPDVEISGPPQTTTPYGAYLLLFMPAPTEPQPEASRALDDLEDAVIGLIRVYLGKAAAFSRVFQNTIRSDGKTEVFGPAVEVPGAIGSHMLSVESLRDLATLANGIPAQLKQRIFLAVRWFNRSHSAIGADSFICAWVALETLAMPRGENIRAVEQAMARVYNISRHAAQSKFLIGRLYGIRGRIVHEGALPGIRLEVVDYVRAILVDLLQDALGAPPRHEAAAVLARSSVEEAIRAALK